MRPHYSHSTRENVTPLSDTSPFASCKGVPPPPLGFEQVQSCVLLIQASVKRHKYIRFKPGQPILLIRTLSFFGEFSLSSNYV